MWLIEGLPGSGKSTLARQLCALAARSGLQARWYLEESHEHPVHPKGLRSRRSGGAGLAQACLDEWAAFVAQGEREVVHILEGSALQSSVRFMLQAGSGDERAYFKRFEDLVAPLQPSMVYLRANRPYRHSQYTADRRGREWSTRVSSYLERTPYARARGWNGLAGMHRFWRDYASLCDELVGGTRLRAHTIPFGPGDWSRHLPEAARFLLRDARSAR